MYGEHIFPSGTGVHLRSVPTPVGKQIVDRVNLSGDTLRHQGGNQIMIKHFCLEVDDIDDVAQKLTAAGYTVTEKTLGADQSWQAWTTDPSGVRIEFHEYTKDSSQLTGENCVLN